MLIFTILAPADIGPANIIPALPSVSVVALLGLWRLADSPTGFVFHRFQLREGVVVAVVLISIPPSLKNRTSNRSTRRA